MRRTPLALAAVAALTTATACSGGGDVAAQDGALTEVTVGALPITAVAPIFLGVEQGFFTERGLNVDVQTSGGGATTVPGVISGDLDFAFGNVVSLMIAREQGLPVKVVANGMTTTGDASTDYSAVVVPEGSDITGADQLDGATVAIDNLQNIGDTSVRNSVRQAGGSGEDIEFIELAFPDMPAALENGNVDAAWVVEPFLTTALQNGATEIAANFVELDPDLSIAAYFTSEQIIAEDPETVDAFTEAMNESLEYAEANPDEVARILPTYTQIDEALIEKLRSPRFPTEIDRDALAVVADLMVTDGLVEDAPDLDALFR